MPAPRHILLLLSLVLLTQACGPVLRQPEEYTPARVRAVKFNDTCQLQPYFNDGPTPLRRQSEVLISGDAMTGKVFGRITFMIETPDQQVAFARLLRRQYRRLPALPPAEKLVALVPFIRRGNKREHMPIHAETVVEAGDESFTLPYSPCLSAFFFGRDYYEMRRRTLRR